MGPKFYSDDNAASFRSGIPTPHWCQDRHRGSGGGGGNRHHHCPGRPHH